MQRHYSFGSSPIHRFHLEDAGPPFYPKYSSLKLLAPSSVTDKFLPWKKSPKYLVGKLPDWNISDDDEKNLKEVVLEEPFRPVSYGFNSLPKSHHFDDVKPVTEHIEGDLKYDFRTKTHSI